MKSGALYLSLLWLAGTLAAIAAEPVPPYGRVAWFVGAGKEERPLGTGAAPRAGEPLRAKLDASGKGEAIILVLTEQDRKVLPALRPFRIAFEPWTEQPLPPPPTVWTVPDVPVEIRVIFGGPGSADLQSLAKLVEAMREAPPRMLSAQSSALRNELGKLVKTKGEIHAPVPAPAIGGVFRSVDDDEWRKGAATVSFRDKPGTLVFACSPAAAEKK